MYQSFHFLNFKEELRLVPGISFQSDEDFEGSSERDIQKDISQFLGYESRNYSLR